MFEEKRFVFNSSMVSKALPDRYYLFWPLRVKASMNVVIHPQNIILILHKEFHKQNENVENLDNHKVKWWFLNILKSKKIHTCTCSNRLGRNASRRKCHLAKMPVASIHNPAAFIILSSGSHKPRTTKNNVSLFFNLIAGIITLNFEI